MKAMAQDFQLVAGHLALDFANTLDNRYDPERLQELLPSYERLLAFARQAGVLSAEQAGGLQRRVKPREAGAALARAIELREAIYFLFRAAARKEKPSQKHLQTLNRVLAQSSPAPSIEAGESGFAWRESDPAASAEALLGPIARGAANLLVSPDLAGVRECSASTCRWLFLDQSKNHSRRWCDMRICGNRAKARRFQARQDGYDEA